MVGDCLAGSGCLLESGGNGNSMVGGVVGWFTEGVDVGVTWWGWRVGWLGGGGGRRAMWRDTCVSLRFFFTSHVRLEAASTVPTVSPLPRACHRARRPT